MTVLHRTLLVADQWVTGVAPGNRPLPSPRQPKGRPPEARNSGAPSGTDTAGSAARADGQGQPGDEQQMKHEGWHCWSSVWAAARRLQLPPRVVAADVRRLSSALLVGVSSACRVRWFHAAPSRRSGSPHVGGYGFPGAAAAMRAWPPRRCGVPPLGGGRSEYERCYSLPVALLLASCRLQPGLQSGDCGWPFRREQNRIRTPQRREERREVRAVVGRGTN